MLIRKTLVWIIERFAELFAGAMLSLIIFGPSNFSVDATALDEIRLNFIGVLFFCFANGYILSCIGFGLIFSRRDPFKQGAIMGILFAAHALLFFLLIGRGSEVPIFLVIGGAVVVFLVNFVGTALLKAGYRS